MAVIRPSDLPAAAGTLPPNTAIVADTGSTVNKATPAQIVDAAIPLATQAEAEAGVDNAKRVTPLRVKQAIAALVTPDNFVVGGTDLATILSSFSLPFEFGLFDDPNWLDATSAIDQSAGLLAWAADARASRRTPWCPSPMRMYSSETIQFDFSGLSWGTPGLNIDNLWVKFGEGPGFVYGNTSAETSKGGIWRLANALMVPDWSDGTGTLNAGQAIVNVSQAMIFPGKTYGFSSGMQLWAEGQASSQVKIHGGSFFDCRLGVSIITKSGGYFNESSLFDPHVQITSDTAALVSSQVIGLYFGDFGGTAGVNNIVVHKPSLELTGSNTHPSVAESVPIIVDSVGSYIKVNNARAEQFNGPLVRVIGEADGNVTAAQGINNEFDFAVVGPGSAPPTDPDYRIEQLAGAHNNRLTIRGNLLDVEQRWSDLREMVWSDGAATGARIAPPFFFVGEGASTKLRVANADIEVRTNTRGIQFAVNGGGIGFQLDTRVHKDFVLFDEVDPAQPGRWALIALDASGAALGTVSAAVPYAPAGERYIKFQGAIYSASFGGSIQSTEDSPNALAVTLRDEVRSLIVIKFAGGDGLVISGIGYRAYLQPVDSTGEPTRSGPLVIDPLLDGLGNGRYASADPDVAGVHGLYSRGMVLANTAAASGVNAGWQCSGGVALARAFPASTALVLGEVIITSDSRALEVTTAGTTAAGAGPSGTTTGNTATSGTVSFRDIGAKASFIAQAANP